MVILSANMLDQAQTIPQNAQCALLFLTKVAFTQDIKILNHCWHLYYPHYLKTLYNTLQHSTTLQYYTTLYNELNTLHHYTTLNNTQQYYTKLNSILQNYTTLHDTLHCISPYNVSLYSTILCNTLQ